MSLKHQTDVITSKWRLVRIYKLIRNVWYLIQIVNASSWIWVMVARDSREYEIRHKLTKLVLFVCILVFLFPEYSKGEKPEDCKPGLQYWSEGKDDHSIVAGPHCVGCPRTLANCEEQPINDRKSCHDSCGKTGKSQISSNQYECLVFGGFLY